MKKTFSRFILNSSLSSNSVKYIYFYKAEFNLISRKNEKSENNDLKEYHIIFLSYLGLVLLLLSKYTNKYIQANNSNYICKYLISSIVENDYLYSCWHLFKRGLYTRFLSLLIIQLTSQMMTFLQVAGRNSDFIMYTNS